MLRSLLVLAIAGALLAGCGGRSARPIPTQQSFDPDMSCEQLVAEFDANKKSINRLNGELGDLDGQNAAVVVGVILAGPAMLFALDNGEAQKQEITAYRTRNRRLGELAVGKDCGNADLAAAATAPITAPQEAKAPAAEGAALQTQPSSTSSAGTTTSVTPEAAADLAAAQAEFDTWLVANKAEFMEALTDLGREEFLPGFESGFRTVVSVSNQLVLAEEQGGWLVELDYRSGPDQGAVNAVGARIRVRVPAPDLGLEGIALAS